MKKILITLLIISLLILSNLYFYFNYKKLEKELFYLNRKLESLNSTLNERDLEIETLKRNFSILQEKYEKLRRENAYINKKLKEYEDIVKEIEYNIEKYKKFISENLNYDFSNKDFIHSIKNYCIDVQEVSYLNLPCAIYILKDKHNFKYINDTYDEIYDIEDFIERGGGDCEDWSLFVAALINYFKKKDNIEKLIVFEQHPGYNFKLYEEGNVIYYYEDAKEVEISLKEYPIINLICYIRSPTESHCIIALSKNILTPKNFEKYILIEPQTGELLKIEDIKDKLNVILNEKYFFFKIWDFWK